MIKYFGRPLTQRFLLKQDVGSCTYSGETGMRRCILMYAVVITGGKQYRVQEGDVLFVEKLDAEVESTVELTEILAVGKEKL